MSSSGSNHRNRRPSILLEFPNILPRGRSYSPALPSTLPQDSSIQQHQLQMSSVSSRDASTLQLVDVADFTTVPQMLPPAMKTAQKCYICGRSISSDLARHIKTHNRKARFKCFYPRVCCRHKSGYFHRKYDLKKHLLHCHFILHDNNAKRLKSLTDKLDHEGACPCGKIMKAREWLKHIISRDSDGNLECKDLKKKTVESARINADVQNLVTSS